MKWDAGSRQTRHGDSSRLTQENSRPLEFGNCLRGMATVAVMYFMDRFVGRTTRTWIQVINFRRSFSRIPLDHKKRESYTLREKYWCKRDMGPPGPESLVI